LSCDRKTYSAGSGDVFVTTWASVAARNAETRKLRSSGDLSLSLDEFIPELREAGFRIGVVVDDKLYGKPLMLTRQDDGRFWIMRYIESTRKIEPDQVFRVENMGQF
jgi:hypothetical protein